MCQEKSKKFVKGSLFTRDRRFCCQQNMILNIFRCINLITRIFLSQARGMPGVESDLLWSQTQNWATLLCLFWATLPHFQQIANHPIFMFIFLLVFHLYFHLLFAFVFCICLLHFGFGMIYLYCIWIWAILRNKREFTKKISILIYICICICMWVTFRGTSLQASKL